jgi:hypothetical protein
MPGARGSRTERGYNTRNALAELIAEGATFRAAGKALGINTSAVHKHWRIICADLGRQAS